MENFSVAEYYREKGKTLYFGKDNTEPMRLEGLSHIIRAQMLGDAEATYLVAKLLLDGVIRSLKYDNEKYALRLMYTAHHRGYVQARAFLNYYCEKLYYEKFRNRYSGKDITGPLIGFDGKPVKIDRKGVLTPVDAVLKYENGRNILYLSVNLSIIAACEDEEYECFCSAVRRGIRMWEGEYEVFGGQKVTVTINITEDKRLYDSIYICRLDGEMADGVQKMIDHIGTDEAKKHAGNIFKARRSFANIGIGKWSVHSRKIIYIQGDDERLNDEYTVSHVVKHEFGHALGLGDLYEDKADGLTGVDSEAYEEINAYKITDKFYNLVMCDSAGVVSNNDIEMVLLAFRDNRMQLFQPFRRLKDISEALGKGN